MLGNLIGGFITIVVGVSLIGPIADDIYVARRGIEGNVTTNVTGAAGTILGLTTLFFSLGIMSAGVALTVGGLRNAGIM